MGKLARHLPCPPVSETPGGADGASLKASEIQKANPKGIPVQSLKICASGDERFGLTSP